MEDLEGRATLVGFLVAGGPTERQREKGLLSGSGHEGRGIGEWGLGTLLR